MLVEFNKQKYVLDREKKEKMPQVLSLHAHIDDEAMAKVAAKLANQGIGLTFGIMTDSDARFPDRYEPGKLFPIRWRGQIVSGGISGLTEVQSILIPDGRLRSFKGEGIIFAGDLVDEINPLAIITPNVEDMHPDHVIAHEIALAVAGKRTPLYSMDTVTGLDRSGRLLTPDFYVPLTAKEALTEKQIYLAHTSQVTNLPPGEQADVQRVLDMTRRRGREIGIPHAAVVFDARNAKESPLADIFTDKIAA